MDANLYKEAIEYEKLTQTIYQDILNREGVTDVNVQHDVNIAGKSSVKHQIDVYWEFKQAGVRHAVLIECKNYASSLTLEKVRNFHSVLNDIGNCNGLMVTKIGYQKGAKKYAEYYGIGVKLLRKPLEKDWEGRVKDLVLRISAKSAVSEPEKPIRVGIEIEPETEKQRKDIQALIDSNNLRIPSGPEACFVDSERVPITEEFKWWLPKQLPVLDKEPGGPYKKSIELENSYVVVNEGQDSEMIVKVRRIVVEYWVEEMKMDDLIIHGEEVVTAILKDYSSGETEYVQRT